MKLPVDVVLRAAGLPDPVPEYRFHLRREWRFDWAWPEHKLAVEVDGGTWSNGRHNRGRGYEEDARKLNAAVLCGWRVLRFTSGMVASGEALSMIQAALEGREYA